MDKKERALHQKAFKAANCMCSDLYDIRKALDLAKQDHPHLRVQIEDARDLAQRMCSIFGVLADEFKE